MAFYLGIDVGGTFTDGVVADERGEVRIFKVPSVPREPALGFLNCLAKAASSFGLPLAKFLGEVQSLKYGTTIGTNLLIEGKTAKTGLITTRGFRDTLSIQRAGREYLGIDLQVERPPSLIPRDVIEEVTERVDRAGEVITPLDMADVRKAVKKLASKGVEAFAVCLLWSFKNPAHEQAIRAAIRKRNPRAYVSISSEIAPLIGEYERTATTVMNASLGPPIARHLSGLGARLSEEGLKAPLLLMQSTGGVTPAEDASLRPITLMNSGPAGGVIGSRYIGEMLGLSNLICVDMGGTSLDSSLITGGRYSATAEPRVFNHNVYVPMIDIHSIGAGGGSIARVDMARRLKVGPQSAGADPGPACYGKGGEEPTVTDADVVLGRINPENFLGGEMPLDLDRAREAIAARIARPLGMDTVEAAWGICRVVDANMAGAIRSISIRKGYDPRSYALVAFGGAGPTHAAALAREIGIGTVVIPAMATAQSAFGIMSSDVVHTFSITDVMGVDDAAALNKCFSDLEEQGVELLGKEGFSRKDSVVLRQADMRYRGQVHEVTVTVPTKSLTDEDLRELIASFERNYQSLYGRGTVFSAAGYELVSFRVDVTGRTKKPLFPKQKHRGVSPRHAQKAMRKVVFDKEGITTAVFDGAILAPGNRLTGPAIVEYMGTTAVIPPDFAAQVDAYQNLILERRRS